MRPYLIVAPDFVQTGGMDRANYALASYLARQRIETHLVSFRAEPELCEQPNVVFHRVPKPLDSYLLAEPVIDRHGRRWAANLASRGGTTVVNGGNCMWADVNWVHYVHAAYKPPLTGSLARKIKAALHARWSRTRERKALWMARLVFTNSARTKADLVRNLGLDPNRVETVYYGINSQAFRPASVADKEAARTALGFSIANPIALFIGELGDRRKGFDVVFAAWQRLCADTSWKADLVVLGEGAELPYWRERARTEGLSERIKFLGKRRDVPAIIAAADLMLAPTRYEAYGLAVHEALCCDLPSFVSASAGVAEQYAPSLRPLLLENPDDPAELANRVLWWQKRAADLRSEIASMGERLREHTWDKMAGEMVELIEHRRTLAPGSGDLQKPGC